MLALSSIKAQLGRRKWRVLFLHVPLLIILLILAMGSLFRADIQANDAPPVFRYQPQVITQVTHEALTPGGKFYKQAQPGTAVDLLYKDAQGKDHMVLKGTGFEQSLDSNTLIAQVSDLTVLETSDDGQRAAFLTTRSDADDKPPVVYFADATTNEVFTLTADDITPETSYNSSTSEESFTSVGWINDYFVYMAETKDKSEALVSINVKTKQIAQLALLPYRDTSDSEHWISHEMTAKRQGNKVLYAQSWSAFYKSGIKSDAFPDRHGYLVRIDPSGDNQEILKTTAFGDGPGLE